MTEPATLAPIRLDFTYTYQDLRATAKLTKQSPSSRRMLGSILLVTDIVLIFVIYFATPRPPAHHRRWHVPASSLWLAFGLKVIPYLLVLLIIWFCFIRKPRGNCRRGPQSITLSQTGLLWENRKGRSDTKWSDYKGFAESGTVFVLFTEAQAVTLPKRLMTSDQIAAFRTLLQSAIGPSHAPDLPL